MFNLVTMEMDALYEGIARRKVSLAVVVVILILVLGPVVTWVAEANGWINLMANLTEFFFSVYCFHHSASPLG